MTAHAVNSPSAAAAASRGAARSAPQDPAAKPFEQQLHAAHQERNTNAQKPPSAHESHPQRGPDPGRNRRDDPSPVGPNMRHPEAASKARESDKVELVAPSDTAAQAEAAAAASSPAATAAAVLASAPVSATATAEEPSAGEKSTDGNQQGASALVGAMLAMIGPAVGKVLAGQPVAAPAAKPTAASAERGTAVLLPVVDVTTMLSNTASTAAAMPVLHAAIDGLLADHKDLHASASSDAASAQLLAASTMPAATAPAAPVSVPLASPVGTPAFTQELGQQVAWFVSHDVKQASIRLHPEELGSLDLKISVSHGRVDVSFQAQHPGAVTALQQSLPQLGDMLAQHGLSLGNAEVGQQQQQGDRGSQARSEGGVADAAEVHGASLVTPLSQIGLLDAFA
ncbi:flagellar hook-length control protein FliK [Rhodanobacter sp. AS-Z3]|uniref:flagellar hook-length control protein FliK n=1 Tax=Rhodanobacter sp. AS-Z3 TaxID=3031330 RepID=UPI002478BD97|nr:flagellar hook-length control protein FliK [Rhodanobacter sp. AS-Z3]WEN14606.1 flagellar hook-length control protein FliK [Rhodanobacter sp. AS-Z3]